jgi:curli production assembly/transport component CsgG
MFKLLPVILLFLTGCATMDMAISVTDMPKKSQVSLKKLITIPPPTRGPIVVAVYKFLDRTGQRKSKDNIASLSSAVTQGADVIVIQALKNAGNGSWFRVVERVGLDHLIKERQLVRSTRATFEGKKRKNRLKPLLFAGVLIEGGIISYDTNILSGGSGARFFGTGGSGQYRKDQVSIYMRVVSVQTGEILVNIGVTKTILSMRTGLDFFRFIDIGQKALEIESGGAVNEPTTFAIKRAVEAAVLLLIEEGAKKKIWAFKKMPKKKKVIKKPKEEQKEEYED